MRCIFACSSAVLAALVILAPTAASAQSPPATASSRNWAGYIGANAYYSAVSALIQTPVATTQRPVGAAAVASWVGIGGASSSDLIQAGVEVATSGLAAEYDAWYETLPQASRNIALHIGPGDWVRVDVTEVDFDLWQITLVDGQQVFQTILPYTSSHSSAEWIVEDPSVAGGLVPLATVEGANFANILATSNGEPATPAQLSAQPVVLVGARGQSEDVPSPLGPDGASFSVGRTP